MSIKKLLILVGLIFVISACSTTGSNNISPSGKKESASAMGVRYLLGRGVPQDDRKAFAYFSQAANDDDPFAQNELAYMYAAGKGTPRDDVQAFKFYQKAANHGLASAQYNLGLMYENGLGTQENKTLAKKWLEKSAAHGFEPAEKALAQ